VNRVRATPSLADCWYVAKAREASIDTPTLVQLLAAITAGARATEPISRTG
jgi:hypothetical protein